MTLAPLPDLYGEGYWERGERSNYRGYGDDPGWPVIAQILRETFPVEAAPSLFEAGCAKGWFVHHAVDAGFRAYGVDISEYAVLHPAPHAEGRIAVADVSSMTDQIGPWDVVCSWEVLEHVPESHIDAVLLRLLSLVKPDGLLVHRIGLAGDPDDCDETHVLLRDRGWWVEKFTGLGLVEDASLVERLDAAFAGRDWAGRFFAHQPRSRTIYTRAVRPLD